MVEIFTPWKLANTTNQGLAEVGMGKVYHYIVALTSLHHVLKYIIWTLDQTKSIMDTRSNKSLSMKPGHPICTSANLLMSVYI